MLSRIFRVENENAAVKRKRQIDTLKIFNDNVLELREDVDYQVQFDAGNRRMAITVTLSPEFPLDKPVLRVSPHVVHPWCNEHSEIVNAPGLLNFTIHSDLGRVVQAIIREFSKNPPQLHEENFSTTHQDTAGKLSPFYAVQPYELPSTSYNAYYNSQFSQFSTNANSYNYNNPTGSNYVAETYDNSYGPLPAQMHYTTNSQNPIPYSSSATTNAYSSLQFANSNVPQVKTSSQDGEDSCTEFPELETLSIEELKKLNEDDGKLEEMVWSHPQLSDIDSAIEDAIDWVEKTAATNIAKEEELEKLKVDVDEKVKNVQSLKSNYDQLVQQYSKLSEIFAPSHIKECLKCAADESQEKSEKIAEDFLNSKIDVERFLSTYIECRKLGQARRTKEEKLAHQLNELKRAGY